MRFMAHYDSLTKLPNRVMFHDRLTETIAGLCGDDDQVSLLYVDLDGFKHVNDTLGHPMGDALLEAAAQRLAGSIRSCDVVARLGGDEFAVICCHPASASGFAGSFAIRLIEQLTAHIA
jgi:diguanylate cyclase (GGDEF)-like protein